MQAAVDKAVLMQFAFSLAIALILWPLFDLKAAYSALLGGSICGAGTFIAKKIMFGIKRFTPAQIVWALFLGEFAKIFVTVIAFYVALLLLELNIAAFILTYIIIILTTVFLMPLIIQ